MNDHQDPRLAHARLGFWTALGTAVTTLVSFGIAIFTPPVSGAFCREDCIGYPYLDIAARFPRDYYWMFPAIVATPGNRGQQWRPQRKKPRGHAGLECLFCRGFQAFKPW